MGVPESPATDTGEVTCISSVAGEVGGYGVQQCVTRHTAVPLYVMEYTLSCHSSVVVSTDTSCDTHKTAILGEVCVSTVM